MAFNQAIIMPALQQLLWDKTLNVPLAGGTVLFFHDNAQTTPKSVYQLTGTSPGSYTYTDLGSELTLSGIGTFVDENGGAIEVYLWPYNGTPNDAIPDYSTADNYYIQVYSSTGVFQFDLHNIPGVVAGNQPSANTFDTTENIISDAQFTDVNFSPEANSSSTAITFTTSNPNQETVIAPDWSVITSGAGSFSVWQETVIDSNAPGNPAYALGISSSTYMVPIKLRQRILAPRILAGTYASGTFVAKAHNMSYTLSMTYTPSITGVPQTICSGMVSTASYGVIANDPPILIANPGSSSGYVDVEIIIPVGASISISCIQICGVQDNTEVVSYIQETPEREIDHLFHYFQPQLNFKPIPSLLVGWDFPLNPQQAGANFTSTTTPAYTWDQTIVASAANNLTVAPYPNTGGFSATTTGASDAFYLLQYLDGGQALEATLSRLAVNISAYSIANSGVVVRPYLFVAPAGAGAIPTLGTTIGTIFNTGVFTLTAGSVMKGWVAIPNIYATTPQATLPVGANLGDIGINGYNGLANYGFSTTGVVFAIVVTFMVPTSGTQVVINSISCVPGDIPTRPAPQALSEVFRECQYYYEVSSPDAIRITIPQQVQSATGTAISFTAPFTLPYQQVKRKAPSISTMDILGTTGKFSTNLYISPSAGTTGLSALSPINNLAFASYFTAISIGVAQANYKPAALSPGGVAFASSLTTNTYGAANIEFNYVLDSRLGIV